MKNIIITGSSGSIGLALISFFAKKARGLMARFIVNNRLTEPEDIKDFNLEGYKFESKANDDKNYIFSRKSD